MSVEKEVMTTMTERMRRVNEAVGETLAEGVAELGTAVRLRHDQAVKTSPDLRQARVYVSVLGNERKREKTLAGLGSAHGVLQAKLADELRMKRTLSSPSNTTRRSSGGCACRS